MSDDAAEKFTSARVTEGGLTVEVRAPYNFVAMPNFTVPSPWIDHNEQAMPRLDKPLAEGLSGELVVRWISESPILVGGAGNDGPKSFLELPRVTGNGKDYAIPGSTLRGLVRSLLEATTMARMVHTDTDAQFGMRDFSGDKAGKNRWSEVMGANGLNITRKEGKPEKIQAGLLRNAEIEASRAKGPGAVTPRTASDKWVLYRNYEWHMLHVEDFAADCGKPARDLVGLSVGGKYEVLDKWLGRYGWLKVPVRVDGGKARLARSGQQHGMVVVSGNDPKGAKTHETVFTEVTDKERQQDKLPVEKAIFERFRFMHSRMARGPAERPARDAWNFWFEAYRDGHVPGIPVFYFNADDLKRGVRTNNPIPSGLVISMARSMKVPYRDSVGTVLARTRPALKTQKHLDIVQALFGHVPQLDVTTRYGGDAKIAETEVQDRALRGRVMFSDARRIAKGTVELIEKKGITASPSPSFWPYYLVPAPGTKPSEVIDWSSSYAHLAGFKRYPARSKTTEFIQPTGAGEAAGDDNAALSKMNFIKGPSEFEGRIRFRNLHPVELGALLFGLFFGDPAAPAAQRHVVGRGKAQGYGRVRAELQPGSSIARNDGAAPLAPATYVEGFKSFLTQWYAKLARTEPVPFEAIPAVADILAMQDPAHGDRFAAQLAYPAPAREAIGPKDSPTLKGYTTIKAAARHDDRTSSARLPRYPRRR